MNLTRAFGIIRRFLLMLWLCVIFSQGQNLPTKTGRPNARNLSLNKKLSLLSRVQIKLAARLVTAAAFLKRLLLICCRINRGIKSRPIIKECYSDFRKENKKCLIYNDSP